MWRIASLPAACTHASARPPPLRLHFHAPPAAHPPTPRRRYPAARLACWFLNWGGTIVIEGDTTLPGVEMKSGTIFVKGAVLEVLPSYKDEGAEEVDGVAYQKYAGDLSRNGEGVLYVSV